MSTTMPAPARPDTHDMVMIHKVFRSTFGALPDLVREIGPGDAARAAVVVGHWDEVSAALHSHHTHEDELLWPKLLDRATLERETVERAEQQHARIATLIELAGEQLERVRAGADPDHTADAATTLDQLHATMVEHMDDEEAVILPLAEQHLTVAEWDQLGEQGRAGIPKDRLLVQVGFILDNCTPAEGREFLAALPLPARIAWRLVGRRAYVKERRLLYGR